MTVTETSHKIWNLLCSLKVAIVLATATTLVAVAGSVQIPFYPEIFAGMDAVPMGEWLSTKGSAHPERAWWIAATGILMALLGVNTLCCFIDWLLHLRARWRKSGEYLIHLGFILVLTAYLWGSVAGFRSEGNRLAVGQTLKLDRMPGYALRLDAFEPLLNEEGRPVDMLNTLTLLRDGEEVARGEVRTNEPLLFDGLTILASNFSAAADGFEFFMTGQERLLLRTGTLLRLPNGTTIEVLDFYPAAQRTPSDEVVNRGERLVNPALRLRLQRPHFPAWEGWYFVNERLPFEMVEAGLRIWPTRPLLSHMSVLTINRDPALPLALAGGGCMTAGVLLALISFYAKRARGDRPRVT